MGTVHSGELAAVTARAVDPRTGKHIRDARAYADLYAPGRHPERDAAEREHPDRVSPLAWDEDALAYVGDVDTAGFAAGVWTICARITGGERHHAGLGFTPLTVLP